MEYAFPVACFLFSILSTLFCGERETEVVVFGKRKEKKKSRAQSVGCSK